MNHNMSLGAQAYPFLNNDAYGHRYANGREEIGHNLEAENIKDIRRNGGGGCCGTNIRRCSLLGDAFKG